MFWIGVNDFVIEGLFCWLEIGLFIGNFFVWGLGKLICNDINNCLCMFYNGD